MYLEEEQLLELLRVLASLSSPGRYAGLPGDHGCMCGKMPPAAPFAPPASRRSPWHGPRTAPIRWKWGSDNPQAFFEVNFPEGWSFNGLSCGTPKEFPQGADYGAGFVGKAPAYFIGYFSSSSSSSSSSEGECAASAAPGATKAVLESDGRDF
ncbi:unnamed protein product [Ectocarpus fasciculatus]